MSHPAPADNYAQLALGYAQRRVILLAALLGGLCITGAGAAWALSSAIMYGSHKNGITMALLGLGVTALGWLATAGLRFTSKPPKPLQGSDRVESNTRNRIISGWIAFGLVLAACLAAILFAPRGKEPDAMALLLMMAAFPAVMLLGFYRIRHIMRCRDELYASWLAKHHG